ncbi:hypothetical protein QL285_050928 [Trifolium repens]|nr:hypothetical protein QL285_050928 [Trifolium repens]
MFCHSWLRRSSCWHCKDRRLPQWVKASDCSNVEECRGHHSIFEMEGISRRFEEMKGSNDHLLVVFDACSRELNKLVDAITMSYASIISLYPI